MKKVKILIVEDDRALNDGVALSLDSFSCVGAYSLAEAERLIDMSFSLIILDINLPDGSGLDFFRRMRPKYKIPVIFLTANDMEIDIVTALEEGADDYITKPFSLAVLRARVNSVLRRRQRADSVFSEDGFVFDFDNMTFFADGREVYLSKTEQKLLKILVSNPNLTLSRDKLIDRLWSDGAEFVEENALSVAVSRLREKLPSAPIKTLYGKGYMWVRE